MAEPVRARRLTDQEGRWLLQIVRRGKHGSVRVRRAMIIMASASGTLVPAIARLVAADEDTVRDVIHTFNAKGLAAHRGSRRCLTSHGFSRSPSAHAAEELGDPDGIRNAQEREKQVTALIGDLAILPATEKTGSGPTSRARTSR
jgi:hypothetical protein